MPPRRPSSLWLIAALACAAAVPMPRAWMHDFWLAPASFRPSVGAPVDVSLYVGHLGAYAPYARNPTHIRTFVAATADTLMRVEGVAGRTPAGRVIFDRPGLAMLGYHSAFSHTVLPAPRFEAYLLEEGLGHLVAMRERRGEQAAPARERFARCAKALLQVGGTGEDGYGRVLGHTLEIVPERNPYAAADSLPVRLLFRGRPLRGAQVAAVHADAPQAPRLRRTDREGRAWLPVDAPGIWLVRSTYVLPVYDDPDVDWESYWASLTFDVPRPAP